MCSTTKRLKKDKNICQINDFFSDHLSYNIIIERSHQYIKINKRKKLTPWIWQWSRTDLSLLLWIQYLQDFADSFLLWQWCHSGLKVLLLAIHCMFFEPFTFFSTLFVFLCLKAMKASVAKESFTSRFQPSNRNKSN